MPGTLSRAKAILLATHHAAVGNIDGLRLQAATYTSVLQPELLLRILLTHLPETLDPPTYTPLLQALWNGNLATEARVVDEAVDEFAVESLSEEQARSKVKKLRLLQLACPDAPVVGDDDPLTLFLFHRAFKIDREAGMVNLVPDLLLPFVNHSDAIRTWLISTIIPLARRNFEYHPENHELLSISDFQSLSDAAAVEYLLSETSKPGVNEGAVGRDLRGVLGPWFHNSSRWPAQVDPAKAPGWAHFMRWLLAQASQSWGVVVQAVEEYNGPADVDLGPVTMPHPQDTKIDHVLHSYLRAAIASALSIPDASVEGLVGSWKILARVRVLLDFGGPLENLDVESQSLPVLAVSDLIDGRVSLNHLRSDLLDESNPITTPSEPAITFLRGLILSAFLLNRLGLRSSIRSAGDLMLLRDPAEQRSEFLKTVRLIASNPHKHDDGYWSGVRNDVLWLHSWGNDNTPEATGRGPFAMVPRRDLESEILKAMLAASRFSLARDIYEDAEDLPLREEQIENAVLSSAFQAFDNASNPNRTRGGLKRCDEITLAFPRTLPQSHPSISRMRALLAATHGLSNYRLVLKQGEPFTPVILRVHSDPISIIERVLEQNPSAYTRVSEFVEISRNLAIAGLLSGSGKSKEEDSETEGSVVTAAERRIVAMCIEAALREDDFETAYSYVMSRLGGPSSANNGTGSRQAVDEWSWNAALKAGQYIRTQKSLQPTHLGTSSGNPEIRHLEQRLECLATALRIAPPAQLLEILKTFRRCEEQLDSAVAEEAAQEEAWDAVGDIRGAPGSFDQPDPERMYPSRNMTASSAARQAEEAPMSLFDLSRATARIASKNFTSLSGMQAGEPRSTDAAEAPISALDANRVRKRDQLREAATGTLVSGVGWLIGANVQRLQDDASP
ncbi:secretory pathway protein sec39 domain-containing protein [Sarocladium implicatum]|nr:secretory pathway protein sec39 domain-containing protein [Sarocladium implicatum]